MLKEHQYIFKQVNMAVDLGVAVVAVLVSHWLRNAVLAPYFLPELLRHPARLSDYAYLVLLVPVAVVGTLSYNGYYASQRLRTTGDSLRAIVMAAVVATAAGALVGFLLSPAHAVNLPGAGVIGQRTSRGVIALLPFVLIVLLWVKTLCVRRVLMALRKRGRNWRSLLLVGSGETLRHFIGLIRNHPFWGFRIDGIIDDSGREALQVLGVPVVGRLSDLLPRLEKHPVDEVVFVPSAVSLTDLTPLLESCEEMGVRTRLPLNFFRHTIARPVLDDFEGFPVVTYSPTREMSFALLFKYVFDRVAAAVALVLLSPVFLLAALAVKLTSQSWSDPIFYSQIRCGLNGRPFRLWKFRSMVVDADKLLDKLRAHNEMQGPVFKMKSDPRITPVGRFLRKTSIDELPQLWNVLRGDMSLVGPRPPIPAEVEKYDRWQRRRLSMRPGITCLWQVSGRNQIGFDEWMRLDLEYIDNWSLWLDFKILLRTIYVVATGYGAM
ncbi:MAG: sugar transferase [Candidatus Sumerlaeaceae bacterium]|nr:sugar transferase [Candidatus Sumerlaeaceae bacterium]